MLFRSLDVLYLTLLSKYNTHTNTHTSKSTSSLQLHVSAHVTPSISCTILKKRIYIYIYIYIYIHTNEELVLLQTGISILSQLFLFKIYNYHENFMKTCQLRWLVTFVLVLIAESHVYFQYFKNIRRFKK